MNLSTNNRSKKAIETPKTNCHPFHAYIKCTREYKTTSSVKFKPDQTLFQQQIRKNIHIKTAKKRNRNNK